MAKVSQAIRALVRPPRAEYDIDALPLKLSDVADDVKRLPLAWRNARGIDIVGSLYYRADKTPTAGGPCVIYLHGDSSNQLEGRFAARLFCPRGVFVFCFDFVGCGCSGGDYVSLGYFEAQDCKGIVEWLREGFHLGPFILWGRSMGAVAALCTDAPGDVRGKISDSSFTSVADEAAFSARELGFPAVFVRSAVWYLKKKVLKDFDFDLNDVSPLRCVQGRAYPTLFGHARGDRFVPFEHLWRLFAACSSQEKEAVELSGEHNSARGAEWLDRCVRFSLDRLGVGAEGLPPLTDVESDACGRFVSLSAILDEGGIGVEDAEDIIGTMEEDEPEELPPVHPWWLPKPAPPGANVLTLTLISGQPDDRKRGARLLEPAERHLAWLRSVHELVGLG